MEYHVNRKKGEFFNYEKRKKSNNYLAQHTKRTVRITEYDLLITVKIKR